MRFQRSASLLTHHGGGKEGVYGFLIIDDLKMINDVTIYNDIFDCCGEDFFVYYNCNICPVYGIPPVVPSSMYMRENLNDVTEIVLPFNDVTSDVTTTTSMVGKILSPVRKV